MKTFPAILFLFLTMGLMAPQLAAQSDDKATIDKFIAAQATKEGGEEPDDIRKVVDGDLNHDGVADVAVLYTIESQGGSNNYIQYLAVFLRKSGKLVYAARQAVGGKNRRAMEITSIANHTILFDVTAYGPRDPSCCPSIKGSTTFVLVGKRLVEKRK